MKTMRYALLTVVLCGMAQVPAIAQEAQPETEAPAEVAAAPSSPEQLDLVALTEFLDEQRALVQEFQQEVSTGITNAEEAELRFDALIASYEKLIQTAGSESEIVVQVDRFVALFEGYAEEAASSEDPERRALSEAFRKRALEGRSLRASFIVEAAKAVALLAELHDQKDMAVDLYRLGEGDRVLAAFRGQLEALTAANEGVRGAIEVAKAGGVPIETGRSPQ